MTYEFIEWWYAPLAGGTAGTVFLGSQGDIWDAQKDMLGDTFGAICATAAFFMVRRPSLRRLVWADRAYLKSRT
jgi:putative membrane protein